MDAACALTEVKETKAAKKTDGTKTKSVRGIPKLTDANFAGTERSKECALILCEGDSAKAGILSGLSSEDRNVVGVYPLKGKLLNVRGEPVKKIADNKEIAEIKQILGLVTGKKYLDLNDVHKSLRYGTVLFMTDQDLDGSHIKGLGINVFFCEWPTLAEIPGFLGFMNTPILKARKGSVELNFYNDGEFEIWKKENDINGWKIKYYKGLGTSTGKEFREYFENKKVVKFEHDGETCNNSIDMVFNKKRSDDRKDWLKLYNRNAHIDTGKIAVTYKEFIDKELIHFSKYDCDRSIPNLMDGLKISLRKILFSAFKRNLTSEVKVAQFSGYVSEHSGYHHGEASLNAAIVGMAQNFVGSNNINLFVPNGQFGTRLQGGKDSASERYIFTQLSKITRAIFPISDDGILSYLNDDGLSVEPIYYAPIIPMVLVNGSKGIGTGFSTDVMCYSPLEIIGYIQGKLQGKTEKQEFLPYYEGFKGSITRLSDEKFLIRGVYEKIASDKIRVTELPVGFWTDDFKELLEHWINPGEDKEKTKDKTKDKEKAKISPIIKDYDDMSKDTNVDFTITFVKGKLDELEKSKGDYGCNGLEKVLKLYTTNSTTNMHLFDERDVLHKYDDIGEIIDAYYDVRLDLYQDRKDHMIEVLEREVMLLTNKARYIKENLDGTVDLRKKTKALVVEMLGDKDYDIIDDDDEYKYLTKMPMDSVTEENVARLNKECGAKTAELEKVRTTTIHRMWLDDLENLKEIYVEYKEERARLMNGESSKPKKKTVAKKQISKLLVEE
jgi:DNA topoisomerase-2